MSLTVPCIDLDPSTFLTRPSGEGVDQDSSKVLMSELRKVMSNFWKRETISRGNVLSEGWEALMDIYSECSRQNWDGYGAEPINPAAVEEALIVIDQLTSSITMPEIVPEPNGGIGFEWRQGSNRVLVVSVRGQLTIDFAAIFGSSKMHGSMYFAGSLPSRVISLFRGLRS
jgi:hypothetical protein